MLLNSALNLATWVGNLSDHQATVDLSSSSHLLKSVESLTLKASFERNDCVSHSFQVVVLNLDISSQDETDGTLTPSLVNIDKFL